MLSSVLLLKPPNTITSLLFLYTPLAIYILKTFFEDMCERIECRAISLTYNTRLSQFQPFYLVHDLTTSFNLFLCNPNAVPRFCHLFTKICQSLHCHSCSASLEYALASIAIV